MTPALQPFFDEVDQLVLKVERYNGKPTTQAEKDAVFLNLLRYKLGLGPLKGKPVVSGASRTSRHKRYRVIKSRNLKGGKYGKEKPMKVKSTKKPMKK